MYKNKGNVLTALSGNIFIFNILGVIAFGNIIIYYYELNFWIGVSFQFILSIWKKTGRKLSMYSSHYILYVLSKNCTKLLQPALYYIFFSLRINDKYGCFFSYLAPRICLLWWRWWWRSPNSERAGAFLTWTTNSRW